MNSTLGLGIFLIIIGILIMIGSLASTFYQLNQKQEELNKIRTTGVYFSDAAYQQFTQELNTIETNRTIGVTFGMITTIVGGVLAKRGSGRKK